MATDNYTPIQFLHIDPFKDKLFDWNTRDSNVYLSRVINSLTKVYGTDFVISGLNIMNLNFVDDVITFDVKPGMLIQDMTLAEIMQTSSFTYNVGELDDSGVLLVYAHYQWLDTPEPNQVEIRVSYYNDSDPNNIIILNQGFDSNWDRTLLGVIVFKKNNLNQINTLYVDDADDFMLFGNLHKIRKTKSSPLYSLIRSIGMMLTEEGIIQDYIENKYNVRAVNGNILFNYSGAFVPGGKKLSFKLADGTLIPMLLNLSNNLVFKTYDGTELNLMLPMDSNNVIIGLPVRDTYGNRFYLPLVE